MMKKLALLALLALSLFPLTTAVMAGNARFVVIEEATRVSRDAKRIHLLVESNLIWSEVPQKARPLLRKVMMRGLNIQSCNAMHMTKRLYKYVQRKGGTLNIRLVDYNGDYILSTKLAWRGCR